MFDLETIRTFATVGAGVAHFVGAMIRDVDAVRHDPAAIGALLEDVSKQVPEIVDAVRNGTAAEDEPEEGDDAEAQGDDPGDETPAGPILPKGMR